MMKVILAGVSTLVLGFFGYQSQSQVAAHAAPHEAPSVACPLDFCPQEDCASFEVECLPSGDCLITCEDPNGETCSVVVDCASALDCDRASDCAAPKAEAIRVASAAASCESACLDQ